MFTEAQRKERKKAADARSYLKHRKARLAAMRVYAAANSEKVAGIKRNYYGRNVSACKQRAAAHRRSPCGRAYMRAWTKLRIAQDPDFRIQKTIRTRLWWALRGKANKLASAVEMLGCSIPEFMGKMAARGQAWENYGKTWELDHVRPCASFDLTDPDQQKQCFHWSNYQPLSVFENRSKGAKWIPA